MDRMGSLPSPSIPDQLTLWFPPPNPVTKINVDASWKIGSSMAWLGLVVQDFGSRCIAVKMAHVLASDATVAESLAILEGCRLAQELNLAQVVIESDSKNVITCLKNCSMSCAWEIFPILSRIRVVGKTFQSCSWS
ncbi:hypothetical protein ACFX16_028615 [Malus domestica]